MKLTILFCFISSFALAQFPDTSKLGKVFIPIAYERSYVELLQLEFRKTKDTHLNIGGIIRYQYQPASNSGNTAENTMVRVLVTQIAMNADIKPEELVMLENLIEGISKPGVYVPPTTGEPTPTLTLKESVNDHDPRIIYGLGWTKHSGTASWITKFKDSDVSLTYTVGAKGSLQFTGKKVVLIGEKCDNHGLTRVEISQGNTVISSTVVNAYKSTGTAANPATATNWCPNGEKTTLFTSDQLPQGTYTINFSMESVDLTTVPRRDSFVFDEIQVFD